MYILGRTGMGKSTLLETLMASDARAGNGFALLDPHGDLAEQVRSAMPPSRTDDLIYFNPATHPLAYNPLRVVDRQRRYLTTSAVIAALKKAWGEFWGPRMEHILRYALMTLTEVPNATLLDLPRLLTDGAARRMLVQRLTDPHIRAFWENEFDRYGANFRSEAIAPILNKVGAFVAHPLIREVLGGEGPRLDLRDAIDSGKIVVANLSKGLLGEDGSSLLGSLLLAGLQDAALSRANTPENVRRDFYLYVDEVQNFTTLALVGMLPELRKYRIGLVMVSQFLEQLSEELQYAILGNVGSLIAFRVGVRDAKILADEFFPEFSVQDLVNLPAHHIYLRLMIDGAVSRGFSALTMAPIRLTERA
jgi:hypothetical protein